MLTSFNGLQDAGEHLFDASEAPVQYQFRPGFSATLPKRDYGVVG
jgi:hypothetical protein